MNNSAGISIINYFHKELQHILTNEDAVALNDNCFEVSYLADDILIKQGSFVSHVLYLIKGLVKIVIEEKNKKHTIIKLINEKNFVGLPILGGQKKYPVTVIALSPVVVSQIHITTMQEIMGRNTQVCRYIIDWFSNDYLHFYSKLCTQNTRNNHGKLASALLYCSEEQFSGTDVFIWLSRKDLADVAGISLESVNKILLELKNDRIIAIKNKTLEILKPELIQTLSTVG